MGAPRSLTELFATLLAGPITSTRKAATMLVAGPDSIVLLTQSLLDFDHPALTFRMHPSSGAVVAEHSPVGPDLLTLDLYDEDVVKIEAELPQFGDHHHGEFVRSQCRFLHLNHLGKCGTSCASGAPRPIDNCYASASSGMRMGALGYSAMSRRENELRR
jgi:hypothetical protein